MNVNIGIMSLRHVLIAMCGSEPVDVTVSAWWQCECRRFAGFVARL